MIIEEKWKLVFKKSAEIKKYEVVLMSGEKNDD